MERDFARGQGVGGDIIRAEGVRFAFPSSCRRHLTPAVSKIRFTFMPASVTPQGPTNKAAQSDLPKGKTDFASRQPVPFYKWCWVTFGEQSRVISRECRSPRGCGWKRNGELSCGRAAYLSNRKLSCLTSPGHRSPCSTARRFDGSAQCVPCVQCPARISSRARNQSTSGDPSGHPLPNQSPYASAAMSCSLGS